ncbi:MAG: amidohydrolase, partial [Deltaproteobacteria bacterium]|nr:amidohydrolase [Deltaproteobacteria bacterium]
TYAATLEKVSEVASGPGWLSGRGGDQNDWSDPPPGGWPLAADLDALMPDRPVVLRRVDGHAAWVNSAALRLSGIDAATPDPEGGRILRDADGNPIGVLVDEAISLLQDPKPDPSSREAWLARGLEEIAAVGLTGVHAMGLSDESLAVYTAFDREQRLPVRIWAYVSPDTEAEARLYREGPWAEHNLKVVGVKDFADGALGSRGALLSEDYADEPGHRGLEVVSPEMLATRATRLVQADAQMAIHAIGDAGVRHALDAYAAARQAHPDKRAIRLRVEHAQVVHPEDVPRFAELGLIASMQPTHATSDMPWAEARLGPERVRWSYAWRTLSDQGAPMAFGSDFAVEEADPGLGLWAAVHRTDLAGNPAGGWYPEQAFTIDEAIAGFTTGAAYAVHEEDRLGSLLPGRPADLTLWRVKDARWQAIATIVDGTILWSAL